MPEPNDPVSLWRNQPAETLAVNLERLTTRRTQKLFRSTRYEILLSITAAFFLISAVGWRMATYNDRLPYYALAAVMLWSGVTAYRMRDRIWPKMNASIPASGIDYYRKVLEIRRDHLRNAWIWHGPLYFAVALLAGIILRNYGAAPLRNVIPFFSLLVLWVIIGVVWRRRQVGELQSEIDELGRL